MKKITILLADDHMVVREGLRRLLDSNDDLVVLGEAKTGREAVEMACGLLPDVVVMDIAMPLLNGLEATRQLVKLVPSSRVLILSAYSDDIYVEQAMQAGAAGFLLKQSSSNTLAHAIREIHAGKRYFSPSIVKRFSDPYVPARAGLLIRKRIRLTVREMEVLQLIAEGKANKETAAELKISIKTVEKHRTHLMQKLDIHDTASLTRYAMRIGIIEGYPDTEKE